MATKKVTCTPKTADKRRLVSTKVYVGENGDDLAYLITDVEDINYGKLILIMDYEAFSLEEFKNFIEAAKEITGWKL